MKKINLKNLFKKNLVTFLILLFAFGFLSYSQNTFAVVSGVATDDFLQQLIDAMSEINILLSHF
jgi:hypothetical protein